MWGTNKLFRYISTTTFDHRRIGPKCESLYIDEHRLIIVECKLKELSSRKMHLWAYWVRVLQLLIFTKKQSITSYSLTISYQQTQTKTNKCTTLFLPMLAISFTPDCICCLALNLREALYKHTFTECAYFNDKEYYKKAFISMCHIVNGWKRSKLCRPLNQQLLEILL